MANILPRTHRSLRPFPTFLALTVVVCFMVPAIYYTFPSPFRKQAWQEVSFDIGILGSQSYPGDTTRARMLDDVLRRLSPGMPEGQVIRLLGPANQEESASNNGSWSRYWLVDRPWPPQQAAMFFRWGAAEPVLEIEYTQARQIKSVQVRPPNS